MSYAAIEVENLSKQYQIGAAQQASRTFREAITDAALAPLRRLRQSNDDHVDTNIWALKDISFTVQPGEVVGIIGRNGAGKSTLLKILSRITEPTHGRVRLRGRIASLLEVGTGFHPELTGRENIHLNGAILGMSRHEISRKFDEIVDFAEVAKFIDTPVKRYSSGMYLRLAFAVAAHLEPEILLVDEVLAVGDAAFQKKCLGKMGEAARGGRTVLFVSHNMAAVSQLCGHATWLRNGQIAARGASASVIQDYLSAGSLYMAERWWPNEAERVGDDRVRLCGARILQAEQPSPILDINRPARIEIDFTALRQLDNLIVGINLYDQYGTCILASADWRSNFLEPGAYSKHVCIPPQLLAEGPTRVLVQLVFHEPMIQSVVLNDALLFEAVDSDDPLSVRGHYKGAWPGVVRVALGWSDAIKAA